MINLQYLIQLSPLILISLIFVLFFFNLQVSRKVKHQQHRINQLNQELNALLSCSRGISEKLHDYQNQFRNITDRQDKLEIGDSNHSGYKQAVALFNRGATEDEMLTTCDMSRGELSLIAHLQKARKKHRAHQ